MKDKTFPRRMVVVCSLGMLVCVLLSVVYAAAPPQFTPIQRTQYSMSLIRGEFDEGDGDLVLISLADADKWVESFYNSYGPVYYPEGHASEGELVDYDDLTSEQKGNFYLRHQRKHHIDVRRSDVVPSAADTAKAAAEASVATDAEIFPEIED